MTVKLIKIFPKNILAQNKPFYAMYNCLIGKVLKYLHKNQTSEKFAK